MSHIIVIPYHSECEVDRYLRIADQMKAFPEQACKFQFLLAASPQIEQSERLFSSFAEIAPTTAFSCPTRLVGYPFGATAMFWDSMDCIAENFPNDGGFSLWFESDMVPIKPDWLDRLSREWDEAATNESLLIMGCFVSEIYKRRAFRRPRLAVAEHVNGGACYAKDFSRRMPLESRIGNRFDLDLFPFIQQHGQFKHTNQIAFSMASRLEQDLAREDIAVVHGIMQDKDVFVESCIAARNQTPAQRKPSIWEPVSAACGRIGLRYFKRGEEFMLESLMAQKDERLSNRRRAA